ncbi:MAG: hypothetical protein GY928_17770 [Colwellia sp.]|nr:hypothetical protein [Colwellia sp.]
MSVCVVNNIPFTLNTVITSLNCCEIKEMAELAMKLGSRGLRFGHLIPTPLNTGNGLNLSSLERRKIEGLVGELQKDFQMPIVMAPGYYTTELFPCAPLMMEELIVLRK